MTTTTVETSRSPNEQASEGLTREILGPPPSLSDPS